MKIEKYVTSSSSFLITKYDEGIAYTEVCSSILSPLKGVGSDYLLVVKENSFDIFLYNSNGLVKEFIPSSLFALHTYLRRHNLIEKPDYQVKQGELKFNQKCLETNVRINLGTPKLIKELIDKDQISCEGQIFKFSSIFLHEPQLIFYEDDIYTSSTYLEKEKISSHPYFKNKYRINIVKLDSPSNLYIYSYSQNKNTNIEFGYAAASYISYLINRIDNNITLHSDDNIYQISIKDDSIYIEGHATFLFELEYPLLII